MTTRASLTLKLTAPAAHYTTADLDWLLFHIGDPDPAVRDALVYASFADGLTTGRLTRANLAYLAERTRQQDLVMAGLPQAGMATLTRSFAALLNTVLVVADQTDPHRGYLTDAQRRYFADRAVRYLEEEVDYTGYDPRFGWVHAVAHGADFMNACVTLPEFDGPMLLLTISRLLRHLTVPLVAGEPERLGAVIVTHMRSRHMPPAIMAEWLVTRALLWRDDAHRFSQQALTQLAAYVYVELDAKGMLTAEFREMVQPIITGSWGE